MANPFTDLAVRYVLADDSNGSEATGAAQDAVHQIQTASSTRTAVGQCVASINRWMGSQSDDHEDDDIISRAKALDFLATTLALLETDLLKADQINLLIRFYGSLFSSDHRAGIMAAAKALRQLVGMKAFQPSQGGYVIASLTALGNEDFKRQTPATRLEIYNLVLQLFSDPMVAENLSYEHGNTCGFMITLVDLCKNERDPQNLIKWFEIQELFLKNFSPIDDVLDEVFKAFSAYFPITLRASATPSGITVEDLKRALRSCFSAHHRIARLAIPFLLSKLDQGEAVTISVKVDILQTLGACLAQYEHVQQGIVPYSDQIWTSLKYEVRNGEIRDSIEATLKTIGTLAKRLEGQDLQTFFSSAWIDLADDLSSESYADPAGQLLTAIAGASKASFSLSTKQALPHIENAIKNTKSTPHQTELISLLNALLSVRSTFSDDATSDLQDGLFGDTLFESVYARFWANWTQSHFSTDRLRIMSKLIDGLSLLAEQRSSDGSDLRLCSDTTSQRIFSWLGSSSIIYPLESKNFLMGSNEKEQTELSRLATQALSRLAPSYPQGLQQLIRQFLGLIKTTPGTQVSPQFQASAIRQAVTRLAYVGCKIIPTRGSPIVNCISVINALLVALHKTANISPLYWTPVIDSIHFAVLMALESLGGHAKLESISQSETLADLFKSSDELKDTQSLVDRLRRQVRGLPEIDRRDDGDSDLTFASLAEADIKPDLARGIFEIYALAVVVQLYRRFVTLDSRAEIHTSPGNKVKLCLAVAENSRKDVDDLLRQLGRLATTVVKTITEKDQTTIHLVEEVFLLFQKGPEGMTKAQLLGQAAGVDQQEHEEWTFIDKEHCTAPLSLGILQGLWPRAMQQLYSRKTLVGLCKTLTAPRAAGIPSCTRAALDNMLTVLANRHLPQIQGDAEWESTLRELAEGFAFVARREATLETASGPDCLEIFRSILHFLAGQITNYQNGDAQNFLLRTVCDIAPSEITMGRQLAQCFEILASPKDCLLKENHAIVKRLYKQWIYQQTVHPYLGDCFPRAAVPGQGLVNDRTATNRSVAIFAILKHLDYSAWRAESAAILRIVIRSLTKFGVSQDINAVLHILRTILENDPDLLTSHLSALVTSTLAIYEMARNVHESLNYVADEKSPATMSRREAAMCRKSCLEFLGKLPPPAYEARYLLPHRQSALRGLSNACGDPIREVRQVAIHARQAWTNMA